MCPYSITSSNTGVAINHFKQMSDVSKICCLVISSLLSECKFVSLILFQCMPLRKKKKKSNKTELGR